MVFICVVVVGVVVVCVTVDVVVVVVAVLVGVVVFGKAQIHTHRLRLLLLLLLLVLLLLLLLLSLGPRLTSSPDWHPGVCKGPRRGHNYNDSRRLRAVSQHGHTMRERGREHTGLVLSTSV